MPIAAVPEYLQKNDPEFYLNAPPGHRFLLYFPVWGHNGESGQIDWRTKDRVKKYRQNQGRLVDDGWTDIENDQFACTIAAGKSPSYLEETPRAWKPKSDSGLKTWRPLMDSLLHRQSAASICVRQNALLRLESVATAPFTTGLGNEHPLENGFAFLNPYGLPYLPGSGVKGVLRCAARELAGGEWGDRQGWSEEKTLIVPIGKDRIALSTIDALFGLESKDGETEHVRGALSFWDVIPQIQGDSLMVEIMTPHQGHYYQQKRDRNSGDSTTPHDSGQPTPISFLTVPAGSSFIFHVVCDLTHLQRLAPDLARDGSWKTLLQAAFEHAFEWLGFGAKTAVGYGAMARPPESDSATGSNANRGGDGAVAPGVSTESVWSAAKLNYDPGRKEIRATFEGKSSAGLKGPEVDALLAALGDRERKLRKDKELKNVAVRVRQEGNLIQLLGLA